jgi:hypothetical protein
MRDREQQLEIRQVFREADEKSIIIICATNQSEYSNLEGRMITIGSSLPPQQGYNMLISNLADVCFPGEEEILIGRTGTSPKLTSLKSSHALATAVASGVAASILYCWQLLDYKFSVRTFDMRQIFKNTCRAGSLDSQFWIAFEKCQNLGSNEETSRAELHRLIERLQSPM